MPDLSQPPRRRKRFVKQSNGSGMKAKEVSIRLRARKIHNGLDYVMAEHPELPDSVIDLLFRANENAEAIIDLCEGNEPDEH